LEAPDIRGHHPDGSANCRTLGFRAKIDHYPHRSELGLGEYRFVTKSYLRGHPTVANHSE
jgi:hypothetical protein